MKKIAINGFGRIGRSLLRSILTDKAARNGINVQAINVGPCLFENLGHLFKYDTVMGTYPGNVCFDGTKLTVDDNAIPVINEPDPACIDWKKYDVHTVIESSGCFTKDCGAEKHITAGAQKVIITAPSDDGQVTIIPGVNNQDYNADQHTIISMGSCTTNCFGPVVKVLLDSCGIQSGIMTTTHAYTNNQVLLDVEHKDPRRARAAALNIIPTQTGAACSILKVFPQLEGKITAHALRIPVPNVSLLQFTFTPEQAINREQLNQLFDIAAQASLKGTLDVSHEPLVSSDYIGNPFAATIDSQLTQVAGTLCQVSAWYDNEYGYCCQLRDFLLGN